MIVVVIISNHTPLLLILLLLEPQKYNREWKYKVQVHAQKKKTEKEND
jgi:hypothetical protein